MKGDTKITESSINEARELLKRHTISTPTVIVFFVSAIMWVLSLILGPYYYNLIPYSICLLISTYSSFSMFTILHESVHHNISKIRLINDLIGRISIIFLGPTSAGLFLAFRFIHLEHHKHTNEPHSDPDLYSGRGNMFTLPIRWATQDLHYYKFLVLNHKKTSSKVKAETLIGLIIVIVSLIYAIKKGYGEILLMHWIIPGRFAIFLLAFFFDYLPHRPHKISFHENKYKTTSFLKFTFQPIFTFFLFFQDYHVVHHLWPTIPFYRYAFAWNMKDKELLSKGVEIRKVL